MARGGTQADQTSSDDFAGVREFAPGGVPELAMLNAHLSPVDPGSYKAAKCKEAVDNKGQLFGVVRRAAACGIVGVPMVYGAVGPDELWHVRVTAPGLQLDLSPERARILGRELIAYSDLCDEGNAS